MRQGQQNRRGRGRINTNTNVNRKGHNHHNPLMRTFQSNGPDQKIHGTPAQIAEKYMSLARDALSSSDHVLAENYLQHAEHYNRIILTYREQQVLALITRGKSNRDIAGELKIAEKTVRIHVSSVLDKLNARDRTQAAIYAIQQGIVHLP